MGNLYMMELDLYLQFLLTINTGSFATTGSNIFIGNQTVTGSISVTNSVTASYFVGTIDGGTF
jgi:hypothetical protein